MVENPKDTKVAIPLQYWNGLAQMPRYSADQFSSSAFDNGIEAGIEITFSRADFAAIAVAQSLQDQPVQMDVPLIPQVSVRLPLNLANDLVRKIQTNIDKMSDPLKERYGLKK